MAIFCHGTSLKKHLATWGLKPASPVSVNKQKPVSVKLLTETSDAGSSLHVARCFFL